MVRTTKPDDPAPAAEADPEETDQADDVQRTTPKPLRLRRPKRHPHGARNCRPRTRRGAGRAEGHGLAACPETARRAAETAISPRRGAGRRFGPSPRERNCRFEPASGAESSAAPAVRVATARRTSLSPTSGNASTAPTKSAARMRRSNAAAVGANSSRDARRRSTRTLLSPSCSSCVRLLKSKGRIVDRSAAPPVRSTAAGIVTRTPAA